MAKQFIYAPSNPIWMNQVITPDPDFNTLPFDLTPPKIPYFQKIQRADITYLQVLSDWAPTLYVINQLGQRIATITPSTPVNSITAETFTVYEFQINWVTYGVGVYTIEIQYTDDTPILQTWRSGFIDVAIKWPQTLLFNYNNSYNVNSVIWSTNIIFSFRVEGNIEDFTPAFEDVIYNDQEYNTTKLNSIPRREFSLYIAANQGGFTGVPNWVGDKLNWIFANDQIKIDGRYYQNTSGSKWEVKRTDPDGTNFIGLKIAIIEVNNLFLQSYQTGILPAGSLQVITQTIPFKNNSANITITGAFKTYSKLTGIYIWNKGGDIFTVIVGTAADGSVPISAPYTTTGDIADFMELNHAFVDAETLYITGLTGTNCDIYVLYDQLDAPVIAPIVSTKKFAKGTRYEYEEVTVGDFATHWNIGTGAGNAGTDYEGCVLSGTNGTKDMNGLIAIGWNSSLPLTRDMFVGNTGNTITQTLSQMPQHSHLMFNGDSQNSSGNDLNPGGGYARHQRNAGINRDYNIAQSGTTPDRGPTSTVPAAAAVPMDISNAARVTAFFVCITD